jgi:ribonuclease HI
VAHPIEPRKKKIHVDALVEDDGLTAISVVKAGHAFPRPVVSRIIHTTGSVEAEMRALLLGMTVAHKARWPRVVFHCDALGVVRMVQGIAECRPDNIKPLRDEAQQQMAEHPEWQIKWIKRTYNSGANAMAGQIMRAYKHGREAGRAEARGEEFAEKHSKWEMEV